MLHLFFLLLFRNKFFFSDFFFFWLPLDFVLLFFSSLVLVIHMRDFGISNQESNPYSADRGSATLKGAATPIFHKE
jgi:hypothetical protein